MNFPLPKATMRVAKQCDLFNQECVCKHMQTVCKEVTKHMQYEWTDRLTLFRSLDMHSPDAKHRPARSGFPADHLCISE